jgi:hypothetical protein
MNILESRDGVRYDLQLRIRLFNSTLPCYSVYAGYPKAAQPVPMRTFNEALVFMVAHELAHVRQARAGWIRINSWSRTQCIKQEVAADRCAYRKLKKYKRLVKDKENDFIYNC